MFSLEAVRSVSAEDADRERLAETMAALVEKSLVIADITTSERRYRLLETTRAHLLLKVTESGERHSIERRHAIYYIDFLERTNARSPHLCKEELLALYSEHVLDVRAALRRSFSEQGDAGIGTALAALSVPLFSQLPHQTTDCAVHGRGGMAFQGHQCQGHQCDSPRGASIFERAL
jgi:predicted ATPase